MQAHPAPARLHTYHSSKKQLLGNQTHAPPAWRTAPGATKKAVGGPAAQTKGSKILLSQLPMDVAENEVEVRVESSSPFPRRLRRPASARAWRVYGKHLMRGNPSADAVLEDGRAPEG